MALVSKDITGLQSGTSYDASVTARGDGETWADSDSSVILTFNTLNKIPTPLDFEIDETNGVHNKTTTAITFRWQESELNRVYQLSYQVGNEAEQTVEINSYQTKTINSQLYGYYELTNLSPGVTYSVKLKRLATSEQDEESDYTAAISATTKQPLVIAAPSNFDMRDTKVIVRWNDDANAASYICQARLNGTVVETQSIYESPAEFTQLVEGNTYTFGLQALAPTNSNEYVDSVEAISEPVLYDVSNLPAPETFQVTDATTTTITLQWTAVDGATGYSLMFREVGGEYESLSNFQVSEGVYTRQVINLAPYVEYEFQLVALGNGDTTQNSLPTVISYRTLAIQLPAVASFDYAYDLQGANRIIHSTTTSIEYQWEMGAFTSEQLAQARRYEIEIKPVNGESSFIQSFVYTTTNSGSTYYGHYTVTDLVQGTEYQARIRSLALDQTEITSAWSDWVTAPTRIPLVAPVYREFLMRVSDFKLEWDQITNAASYVAVAKNQQGTAVETVTPSVPAAVFTTLTVGETYDFEVVAKPSPIDNYHCDSAPFLIDDITYQVSRLPLPETYRGETTPDSITVEWSEVAHSTAYNLKYRQSGAQSYIDIADYSQYSSGSKEGLYYATLSNLEANTSFEFQLVVVGDGDSYLDSEPGVLNLTTGRNPAAPLPTPSDFAIQTKDEDGLDADYLSYDFVRLMWSPIANAVGYRVRYRKTVEQEWTAVTNYSVYAAGYNIDKCYLEIHSLDSLTGYTFDIIAIGDNVDYLNSTETTITATTDRAPAVQLATPQDFQVSGVAYNFIMTSWSPVANASGYRVRYKKSADQVWATTTEFTESHGTCQAIISSLDSGTEYTFELTAVGDSLDYTDSNPVTTTGSTVSLTQLVQPEIFRASNISETGATLEWSSVQNATGYRLRYRSNGGGWTTLTEHTRVRATVDWQNVLSGLRSNTEYECELVAVGNGSDIIDSEPAQLNFTTLVNSNLDSTTLTATIVNGGFYCQWESVDGANSYVLAYFDTQNDESSIVESIRINGSETYWQTNILTSDPDGQGYLAIYPSVLPTNGTGNERKPWSNFVQVRDVGSVYELLPPRNVNVVGTTMSVISLEWEPVLAATSYVVKCGTKEIVTQSAFADITGLLADTDYEIQVKSRSTYSFFARNESDYGAPITARTAQRVLEKLEAPNIRLVSKTDSAITVNWEFVEHASGYKLFYNVAGSGNPATKIESYETVGNKAQVTITGLSAATNYIIEALAVGDAYDYQDSDRSRLTVKTDSAPLIPLDTPSGLVCVDKTKDTISLEWNGVANASGYIVSYGSRTISVTNPAAVLPNLAHGRTYSIKVKAVGDGSVYGDSPYTAAIRVETDSDPIPEGERKTALNYIRTGRLVSIKPTEVIPKGTAIKQGAVVGVINHTRFDEDKFGSLELDGIYNVPLASGASFALGDLVCLDDDGNAAASGMKFGYAIEATNSKSRRVKTLLVPWLDTLK